MKRLNDNKNILAIGLILLVVFGMSIFMIGGVINRIARGMNNSVVAQSCLNHFNEIAFELHRTEQVGQTAKDIIYNKIEIDDAVFETLASTLLKLDPKIGRIWLMNNDTHSVQNYLRANRMIATTEVADSLQRLAVHQQADSLSTQTLLYESDSLLCWTLTYEIDNGSGGKYLLGLDVYIPDFYEYIKNQPPTAKSYAAVTDRQGVVLLHPDSLLLGRVLEDSGEIKMLDFVCSSQQKQQHSVMSEYLDLLVERIYYPITINNQQLIVIVNIPHLSINDEMRDFHRYTLLIALIAVVLFSVLLALSQARWRREYHLRRKAEQESLKLQLQQIVDQINPHFLFNSLNSLYALIGRNVSLAREFVLSLSKVYRHVLEAGKDSLSSLDKEIEFVREYYFLQKIRFNEQIDLRIDIDKRFDECRLPTMSVQTVVENAIKHNKITPDNPLRINIFTHDQRLIIENNYTPREDSQVESSGVGLERIHSIYNLYTDDKMVVTSNETTFRCELPLLTKN